MKLLLLALVRFGLSLNCTKGTGALPVGRITVVSTGDLLPFLHSGGVNIYLSLSVGCAFVSMVRDNGMALAAVVIKHGSS